MSVRRRAIKTRVERDRKFNEGMERLKAGLWNLLKRVELAQRSKLPSNTTSGKDWIG